ncbi:MAG: fibronectin type III domain-containing protein, partial [Spirochaetaceae bacterium]|nr:fibronectin type III domain-containing protein [Spirochaetaceae bacterium]
MKNITKLVMLLIMVATLMVALVSCEQEPKVKYVDKKADSTAPAKVTNLAATPKDTQVLLTWTDAEDEDVYGYEVSYIQTSAENSSRVVLAKLEAKTIVVSPGTGGCYVTGLTNDTEYTFTVKTVDTSGNKSEGATVTGKPVEATADTMKINLSQSEPGHSVTVTAIVDTTSTVRKVVYKKNGSLNAKSLLDSNDAIAATVDPDNNKKWTFTIEAEDETANGYYTVAALDALGREEAAQIYISNIDFTP